MKRFYYLGLALLTALTISFTPVHLEWLKLPRALLSAESRVFSDNSQSLATLALKAIASTHAQQQASHSLLSSAPPALRGDIAQFEFPDQLIFQDDLESGEYNSRWKEQSPTDTAITVVAAPGDEAGKSLRFELHNDDPHVSHGPRAELALPREPANAERWYAFRHFIPADWAWDGRSDIIAQWHAVPDWDKGENYRMPPLHIQTNKGKLKVITYWDAKEVTQEPEGPLELWSEDLQTGQWIDWVFHVQWSHQEDGLVQVWRNGENIINYQGPNTYNDEHGVYFKGGIYKPGWRNPSSSQVEQRVLYMDDFRFADTVEVSYEAGTAPSTTSPISLTAPI